MPVFIRMYTHPCLCVYLLYKLLDYKDLISTLHFFSLIMFSLDLCCSLPHCQLTKTLCRCVLYCPLRRHQSTSSLWCAVKPCVFLLLVGVFLPWLEAGFLDLSTVDVWGWIILCDGGCLVCCRVESSIPGLYPQNASGE